MRNSYDSSMRPAANYRKISFISTIVIVSIGLRDVFPHNFQCFANPGVHASLICNCFLQHQKLKVDTEIIIGITSASKAVYRLFNDLNFNIYSKYSFVIAIFGSSSVNFFKVVSLLNKHRF